MTTEPTPSHLIDQTLIEQAQDLATAAAGVANALCVLLDQVGTNNTRGKYSSRADILNAITHLSGLVDEKTDEIVAFVEREFYRAEPEAAAC